jgi:hypothetical protein
MRSCNRRTDVYANLPSDVICLLRQGVGPKGIVGWGMIISENREKYYGEDSTGGQGRRGNYATIEWESVIDAEQEAPLARLALKERFP